MIKCFIFDMDGVITSSSDEHFAAWKVLIQELGYELDPEVERYTRGVSRMDSLNVILKSIGRENDYTEDEKEQFAENKNNLYIDMITKFTEDNLYPGVLRILKDLKQRGIKIALGSASKNGPLLLDKLGIAEYFDYVVNPADVKHGKPAPDIFLAAAEHLGVEPTECVGVEDAIAGIKAIKSAGMFAVGIGDEDVLCGADVVFPCVDVMDVDEVLKHS